MTEVKHDGVTVKMGGVGYVVPPLSFKQLKRLMPEIEAMQKEASPIKNMETTVKITHAALSRNYPDLTLDDVEDMVDLKNIKEITEAVMGSSGFFGLTGIPPKPVQ